MAFCGY